MADEHRCDIIRTDGVVKRWAVAISRCDRSLGGLVEELPHSRDVVEQDGRDDVDRGALFDQNPDQNQLEARNCHLS